MTNPDSAGVSAITVEIQDGNGQVIDSTADASWNPFGVTTVPGTLLSISLTNSKDQVGEYGQLEVEIDIVHHVEAGGHIQITFSKWSERDESYFEAVDKCTITSNSGLLTVGEDSCRIESIAEGHKITV